MATPQQKKVVAVIGIICIVIIVAVGAIAAKPKSTSTATTTQPAPATNTESAATNTDTASTEASTSSYKDGTYTADGSYRTPESTETINVSLTIKDGAVTDSTVTGNPSERESEEYQSDFESGYKTYVTGKKLDDIKLSRVSGSSLTSNGFNAALTKIKSQAAA